MARSQDSFNKKEKEKLRRKKKQEKQERKEQRKIEKAEGGPKAFEDMLSYVDENGHLSDTPPDPAKKKKFKVEDIVLGVPSRDDADLDPIRKGQVKFFNDEKGYGFIVDTETKDSIFVHINSVRHQIKENDKVIFEVEMGPKGPNAVNVKLDTGEPKPKVVPKSKEESTAKEESSAKGEPTAKEEPTDKEEAATKEEPSVKEESTAKEEPTAK